MATASSSVMNSGTTSVLWNGWRAFVALWYLFGSPIHVFCALFQPHVYTRLGKAPLDARMGTLWYSFFMPHITFFALLLAAFELVVGILLLSRGRLLKIALTASILFNLFLVQLGLGYVGSGHDFLLNRLSTLWFALIQIPLYWVTFDKTLPAVIRSRLRR